MAIKVQYIDLQDRFTSDLKAIVYLLKAVTIIHPKFDLHWVLDVNMYLSFANVIIFTCIIHFYFCKFSFLLLSNFVEIFLYQKKLSIFIGGH